VILDFVRDLGAGLSRFTERWVPDSWVICMILTTIAAMQFTIAMVAAHACVSSRPVFHLLDRLASLPDPEKPSQAVLLAALFSLVTAYLNWALCLVACALFVPFICRRNPKVDIRVLIAGAYIGLGTVWHGGFSGSAPLILATPGNPLLAPTTGPAVVDRLYPVTETLFAVTLSPEQVEAILPIPPPPEPPAGTPAARIDAFRGWVWLAAGLLAWPLGNSIVTRGFGASWTINSYNAVFLVAALLLHGRPLSFLRACRQGVDAAWGIIIQFPFYAGIFGLMQNTGLGQWIGQLFAELSSQATYPTVVYLYSAVMNLFVPSAGSKWLIEAPYLIPAAQALDVGVITTLLAYSYGDSTTNLIQPFFAIPILAVTKLRFGDVVGYTFLIACACFAASILAMVLIPAHF
jgi:short-chain fatty acids transporter